ncbi:MAG: hypothetical protein QW103_01755 [Candidatus Pacearchaeota archaeon]
MEKYIPKIISVSPDRIIPYHFVLSVKKELIEDYKRGNYIPPIPIISAPKEFRKEGDYINYNGHHRTLAAKLAKVFPLCILLDNWEDIEYLIKNPPIWNGQIYPELIEGLEKNFEAHKNFIISEAKRLKDLRRIANEKRININ